jgi:hypothetical protein
VLIDETPSVLRRRFHPSRRRVVSPTDDREDSAIEPIRIDRVDRVVIRVGVGLARLGDIRIHA